MIDSCKGQSGASAVEFALLLPVLVLLLFGTMYGGALFNTQQTVTQAAREGARYAATLPLSFFSETAPPPANGDWFGAVEGRALSVLSGDRPLTPGQPEVCVRFYDGDGGNSDNGSPACSAGSGTLAGPDGPRVEVLVQRPARLELGIASIGPLTLSGTAVARFEPDTDDGGP